MTDTTAFDYDKLLANVVSRPGAAVGAVLGNLIPIYGVLRLGWDPGEILILYWLENVVLGVFAVWKIRASGGGEKTTANLPALFVLHYGAFCAAHLAFVLTLAAQFAGPEGEGQGGLARAFDQPGFAWAFLGMVVVDGVSQWWDWWRPERWRTANPGRETAAPYGRIVVLHMTLLIGTGLMVLFNAPAGAIVILCLMKAALEILTVALKDMIVETPKPT